MWCKVETKMILCLSPPQTRLKQAAESCFIPFLWLSLLSLFKTTSFIVFSESLEKWLVISDDAAASPRFYPFEIQLLRQPQDKWTDENNSLILTVFNVFWLNTEPSECWCSGELDCWSSPGVTGCRGQAGLAWVLGEGMSRGRHPGNRQTDKQGTRTDTQQHIVAHKQMK